MVQSCMDMLENRAPNSVAVSGVATGADDSTEAQEGSDSDDDNNGSNSADDDSADDDDASVESVD